MTMIDREKVISEFEEFVKSFSKRDDTYYKGLFVSVLAMLKEQEPLPVRYVDKGDSYPPCIYHSVCRACGGILNYPEKFCKACGRGIIWVPFCKEEADV